MILDEIRTLLSTSAVGDGAPTLARIEDILTAGYARALELEAEQRSLQRRLADAATELSGDASGQRISDLTNVARRLKATDTDLAELRRLLGPLSDRAARLRAA